MEQIQRFYTSDTLNEVSEKKMRNTEPESVAEVLRRIMVETPTSDNFSMEQQSCLHRNLTDNLKEPESKIGESIMAYKTARKWAIEASQRKDPERLWLSMWHEGEICCLFADSNVGKSIYAVEIAQHIAKKQRVLYCDFELSDKQFQLRYSNDKGVIFPFSDDLIRAEIDTEALCEGLIDMENRLIEEIERGAVRYGANVIIIDNLSYLCNASDKSDIAGRLMLRLMDLKRRRGYSILVLAHTPKRSLNAPITQNDLAGSKKLFNFFDSVFAIGKSAQENDIRYIKQLKIRAGKMDFGSNNVIVARIEKTDNWLHFSHIGYASEAEHLKKEEIGNNLQRKNVEHLRNEGFSLQEIADKLGITKSKVYRLCQKNNIEEK